MLDPTRVTFATSALGSALALVFAVIVLRANARASMNRRLAALLIADGLFFAFLASGEWVPLPDTQDLIVESAILLANATAHLLFAATLDTPLVRWLRGRTAFLSIIAASQILFLTIVVQAAFLARSGSPADGDDLRIGFPWPAMALASLFALVASIDVFRRTPKGGPAHRRARSFALAFGSRDLLIGLGILGYGAALVAEREDILAWMPVVIASGVILFVSFLTYGILSTQLFDIDLRLKWGISRSTVLTIGIVAVLGALKTAEYTFNRTLGAVAAGLTAGLVLVLAPRLNKLGDKVANAAMPAVQPTTDYVAYKKLEVYRAAIESAIEGDRAIDKAERAMLDRLRLKLGLAEADAKALEAELTGGE